jgi:hypothetical protein
MFVDEIFMFWESNGPLDPGEHPQCFLVVSPNHSLALATDRNIFTYIYICTRMYTYLEWDIIMAYIHIYICVSVYHRILMMGLGNSSRIIFSIGLPRVAQLTKLRGMVNTDYSHKTRRIMIKYHVLRSCLLGDASSQVGNHKQISPSYCQYCIPLRARPPQ